MGKKNKLGEQKHKVVRRRRRKLRYKRLLLVILVLAAIVYGVFYGYGLFMERQGQHLAQVQVEEQSGNEKALKPAIAPQFTGERFKDYNNILVMGVDDDNPESSWDKERNADALEILSFNDKDKSLRIITIPRNLVIASSPEGDLTIGQVYYNEGGVATVNQLANYLEIPITQYIALDRKAFSQIVDALGGVDFYVANDMNYEDPYKNTAIHLAHGYQTLDGDKASQYLSFRADELGDSGRMQRQQQFIKILYKQFTSVEGIKAAPKLFRVLKNSGDTNIKIASLSSMTDFIKAFTTDNFSVQMLPGKADAQGNWVTNPAQVQALMEKLFPEETTAKEEK